MSEDLIDDFDDEPDIPIFKHEGKAVDYNYVITMCGELFNNLDKINPSKLNIEELNIFTKAIDISQRLFARFEFKIIMHDNNTKYDKNVADMLKKYSDAFCQVLGLAFDNTPLMDTYEDGLLFNAVCDTIGFRYKKTAIQSIIPYEIDYNLGKYTYKLKLDSYCLITSVAWRDAQIELMFINNTEKKVSVYLNDKHKSIESVKSGNMIFNLHFDDGWIGSALVDYKLSEFKPIITVVSDSPLNLPIYIKITKVCFHASKLVTSCIESYDI